jgi:hypothetical protein
VEIYTHIKSPSARQVMPLYAYEVLSMLALVIQAQTNLAGHPSCTRWSSIMGFWMAWIWEG